MMDAENAAGQGGTLEFDIVKGIGIGNGIIYLLLQVHVYIACLK
jgi:hypothetical protein